MCFKKTSHLNQMEDILYNITAAFEICESGVFCPDNQRVKIHQLKVRTSYFV